MSVWFYQVLTSDSKRLFGCYQCPLLVNITYQSRDDSASATLFSRYELVGTAMSTFVDMPRLKFQVFSGFGTFPKEPASRRRFPDYLRLAISLKSFCPPLHLCITRHLMPAPVNAPIC